MKYIYFADDDADDHFIFLTAFKEAPGPIVVYPFFYCQELLSFLNDINNRIPDLIFLAHNIVGNKEYECLKTIKKTPRLLNIPVVILSSSQYSKHVEEAFKLGAYRYISKPTSINQLKETITGLISELS